MANDRILDSSGNFVPMINTGEESPENRLKKALEKIESLETEIKNFLSSSETNFKQHFSSINEVGNFASTILEKLNKLDNSTVLSSPDITPESIHSELDESGVEVSDIDISNLLKKDLLVLISDHKLVLNMESFKKEKSIKNCRSMVKKAIKDLAPLSSDSIL